MATIQPQTQDVITQTKAWVEQLIVKYSICPFARREVDRDSIRYLVSESSRLPGVLEDLISECEYLDQHPDTETTLLIIPAGFEGFWGYLDLVDLANELISQQGYEGVYQLASFHPDYCFDGEPEDDPANYTNRSPYPVLHILREASLEQALASYSEPESIPDRNIAFARRKGRHFFTQLLATISRKTAHKSDN
ncbi:hypothetical protein IDSA_06025 [Pseudidiomarina salinarum]|uniref:DUF1415 domain-containing protein n=1 Tax=Pseudidiomarina salinarum TaxID=435908 RepID=A0A094IV90_9GAMM|nr:DUF1415 domain-containing protein [Pseudidiomarina salinarum]KFZ31037.1 hypothetical protein IDSA_06025 [Pseudidiomarina salinarum]RUO71120.1 DUF1415 domain-containing protein [Pseudidiomarina salinarum]